MTKPIIVKILDTEFEITPEYFEESIGVFIESAIQEQKESHLIDYLKQKYNGFVGVPVEYLNDELLLDTQKQVENFLKLHFAKEWNKTPFIPFELVADHISYDK